VNYVKRKNAPALSHLSPSVYVWFIKHEFITFIRPKGKFPSFSWREVVKSAA